MQRAVGAQLAGQDARGVCPATTRRRLTEYEFRVISPADSGDIMRLTDGGASEARSAFFKTPVNVQSFVNDFSFVLTNANADGFTFTIQGTAPTALGAGGGDLGYGTNSSGSIPGIGTASR